MMHIITVLTIILLVLTSIYCHSKIKHIIWLQHDFDINTDKYNKVPKELILTVENQVKLISLVLGRLFSLILAIAIFVLKIL